MLHFSCWRCHTVPELDLPAKGSLSISPQCFHPSTYVLPRPTVRRRQAPAFPGCPESLSRLLIQDRQRQEEPQSALFQCRTEFRAGNLLSKTLKVRLCYLLAKKNLCLAQYMPSPLHAGSGLVSSFPAGNAAPWCLQCSHLVFPSHLHVALQLECSTVDQSKVGERCSASQSFKILQHPPPLFYYSIFFHGCDAQWS